MTRKNVCVCTKYHRYDRAQDSWTIATRTFFGADRQLLFVDDFRSTFAPVNILANSERFEPIRYNRAQTLPLSKHGPVRSRKPVGRIPYGAPTRTPRIVARAQVQHYGSPCVAFRFTTRDDESAGCAQAGCGQPVEFRIRPDPLSVRYYCYYFNHDRRIIASQDPRAYVVDRAKHVRVMQCYSHETLRPQVWHESLGYFLSYFRSLYVRICTRGDNLGIRTGKSALKPYPRGWCAEKPLGNRTVIIQSRSTTNYSVYLQG
jgi:hypothetical protein